MDVVCKEPRQGGAHLQRLHVGSSQSSREALGYCHLGVNFDENEAVLPESLQNQGYSPLFNFFMVTCWGGPPQEAKLKKLKQRRIALVL